MTEGKCPDCYGEGKIWVTTWPITGVTPWPMEHIKCGTCDGTGKVPDELLAQREAEYHAWLRKRKKVKA